MKVTYCRSSKELQPISSNVEVHWYSTYRGVLCFSLIGKEVARGIFQVDWFVSWLLFWRWYGEGSCHTT
jgi:hypothetical protein